MVPKARKARSSLTIIDLAPLSPFPATPAAPAADGNCKPPRCQRGRWSMLGRCRRSPATPCARPPGWRRSGPPAALGARRGSARPAGPASPHAGESGIWEVEAAPRAAAPGRGKDCTWRPFAPLRGPRTPAVARALKARGKRGKVALAAAGARTGGARQCAELREAAFGHRRPRKASGGVAWSAGGRRRPPALVRNQSSAGPKSSHPTHGCSLRGSLRPLSGPPLRD